VVPATSPAMQAVFELANDVGEVGEGALALLQKVYALDRASEYVDEISGKNSDRPEFQRMFADASQRKFELLLFWSLDRLSREGALETLQHLNCLTGYGIQWRSLTEQYLDSTGIFREAVISILAVIAKQERIRLSERTRAGLEQAGRKGKILGRPRVKISPDAIRQLRAEGLSWSAIANRLGVARSTAQCYAAQR
jgi:DNA invertase Pin-like site-specific DNA recombinase